MELWGRAKLPWLRQFLPFGNGIASHDTFGRGFALLDAAVFEQRFVAWMASVCGALGGLEVAIDAMEGGARRPARTPAAPLADGAGWKFNSRAGRLDRLAAVVDVPPDRRGRGGLLVRWNQHLSFALRSSGEPCQRLLAEQVAP